MTYLVESTDVRNETDLDRYHRLKTEVAEGCEQIANGIMNVGKLLGEIKESKLYKLEHRTWEEFCLSLDLPTFRGLTYKRANQLIAAHETGQALIAAIGDSDDIRQDISNLNEATLRAVRSFPEERRAPLIEQALEESRASGESITAPMVMSVGNAMTLAEIEETEALFSPWGTFAVEGDWRKKGCLFSFANADKTVFFQTIQEAKDWHLDNCNADNRCQTMGCWNCQHMEYSPREYGANFIHCAAQNQDIGLNRVWTIAAICGKWRDIDPANASTLTLAPPPTPTHHPAGVLAKGAGRGDKDGERDERYTPQELWQPGLNQHSAEAYDLDPSSCERSRVPAKRRYTKEDNGLIQPWAAQLLFGNFPFSLNLEFAKKMVEEYLAGNIGHAYLALKTDHRTRWYNLLLRHCTAVCEVSHGVKYDNTDQGCFFGTSLFYFGDDLPGFYAHHNHLGMILVDVAPALPAALTYPEDFNRSTSIEIQKRWRKVGIVSLVPKYADAFMVEYGDQSHYFQTQEEAWIEWRKTGQYLIEGVCNDRIKAS